MSNAGTDEVPLEALRQQVRDLLTDADAVSRLIPAEDERIPRELYELHGRTMALVSSLVEIGWRGVKAFREPADLESVAKAAQRLREDATRLHIDDSDEARANMHKLLNTCVLLINILINHKALSALDNLNLQSLLSDANLLRTSLITVEVAMARDVVQASVDTATSAASAAEDASEAAQESAGAAGTGNLAHYFEQHAQSLHDSSQGWTRLLAAVLALIVLLGGVSLYGFVGDGLSLTEQLGRLALSLPLVAFAAFVTARANRIAQAAQRADEIAVRLRSVRAYTSALEPGQRHQIMADLASEVFSVGHLGQAATAATVAPAERSLAASALDVAKNVTAPGK